jgi:transposase
MKDNGFALRVRMVETARLRGISAAAREFNTSRITVRKWLKRFSDSGLRALQDRSRAPKSSPNRISPDLEAKILDLRRRYRWGPHRLKAQCGLPCSPGAIYRSIRQAGLIQKRIPKWQKKRDLRQKKKGWPPFQKIQVDVKDLSDIPEYWPPPSPERLPRYEFTAREVRTGMSFVAFAHSNDQSHAGAFARYLLEHLGRYGVDLGAVRIQTDNGNEFVGPASKKNLDPTEFQEVVAAAGARHDRIPPARSTWNSDVESFHRTVEDELYSVEPLRSRAELLGKAYTYQLFYNHFRKNRWRKDLSPREILEQVAPRRYDPGIFSLPPVILEDLLPSPSPGNDVPGSPRRGGISP